VKGKLTMATCFEFGCAKQVSGGLKENVEPPHYLNPNQSTRKPEMIFWCEDHEESCRLNPQYVGWESLTAHELKNL